MTFFILLLLYKRDRWEVKKGSKVHLNNLLMSPYTWFFEVLQGILKNLKTIDLFSFWTLMFFRLIFKNLKLILQSSASKILKIFETSILNLKNLKLWVWDEESSNFDVSIGYPKVDQAGASLEVKRGGLPLEGLGPSVYYIIPLGVLSWFSKC